MISSIVSSLLLFPLLAASSEWKSTCGTAQRQSLLNLISTDIVVRHFNSGALNATLTECSNFHRHLCPQQGLSASASTQGLFDQIVAIERGCSKYDLFSKLENDFARANQFDHFDYTNDSALSAFLFLLPKATLLTIYEYTTLHIAAPGNFYSYVWNLRKWNSTIDQAKFPAKYNSSTFATLANKKAFTNSLAANLKTIITKIGGIQKMKIAYLPFLKDVTDYNHVINVMYREGKETGATRDHIHDAITKVTQEYSRVLQTAAWSSADNNGKSFYNRFYDAVMDIYQNTLQSDLDNLGVKSASLTFSRDFYNFYVEERNKLAPLMVLPWLRTFIAVNRAHARMLATVNIDMTNRWSITSSVSNPTVISGFFFWVCVRNQAIFDLVGSNSPEAAVYGVMSYVYGHEMYHGIERELYPQLMPTSPVVSASKDCVKDHFDLVEQRFPGDPRWTFFEAEDEADVYGTEIAYGAFKTAIGSRIDELAYPSLNISQQQLFFYANSMFGCNVHGGMTINGAPVLFSQHYQVNGRLGQRPEFQSAFQCSATDDMVFPQNQHCPIFFPTYTA